MTGLERFKSVQAAAHGGFDAALAEIRAGGKRGHWIWYIFPQLAGLGASPMSVQFAIADEAEAIEYVRDPDLRARLLTIATAVAEQLKARQPASLRALMGSDTDARKVVSSLTLFRHVAEKLGASEQQASLTQLANVAAEVLSIAAEEGYPLCAFTLRQLRSDAE
jgi:uncharacterized protein (DUF1810 family)